MPPHIDPKTAVPTTTTPPVASLDTLAANTTTHGFTVVARFTGADGKPIGARFVHDATKFTFDYLRIESAPQGFLYANSFPTSDKGEPHTQEHLLLGKGNRGRKLGSAQAMALATSSAFTEQLMTAYHFHTVAANETFWDVFDGQLDAMLNPDYTDEEIRREVRNFGVDKGDDGALHLEEKGTVYNEMVRTYESPDAVIWREAMRMVYGTQHPLAYESGGTPEAIRTMTPQDIRTFHDAAYHLANMGVIAAFPSAMALPDVLDHVAHALDTKAKRTGIVMREADLPKPAPAPAETISLVEYPFATPTNPGPMMLVWPATRALDATERLALQLFLDSFGGDESTTLYKKLIDGKTRVFDTGASGVGFYVSDEQGEPIMMSLSGVRADKLDAKTIGELRKLVADELAAVAKLPDGDPALVALNARVASRVVDLRRQLGKSLDTTPGFGFRGIGAEWYRLLRSAGRQDGFDKSLVFGAALDAIHKMATGGGNPWRERIATWGLATTPFGLAAKSSPAVRAKLDGERKTRIADELAAQKAALKLDDKATLAKLAADEAEMTRQLDDAAKATPLPELVASPPMTNDDGLIYEVGKLGNWVKTLRATFDSMASARVSIAFNLQGVAPKDMWYLPMLPTLLSDVGILENGTPVSAEEVRERQRKEVLEVSVGYSTSQTTDRVELSVSGAGSTPDETRRALGWMTKILTAPDWRIENLPRIRDLVDQGLIGIRQRMQGPEEYWVSDPRDAWDRQAAALRLHVGSFLTIAHDLLRLRWELLDPGDAKVSAEAQKFIAGLADQKGLARAKLVALAAALSADKDPKAAKLSAGARALAKEAGRDLAATLGDIPDGSLAGDWAYLCKLMAAELGVGSKTALGKLESLRTAIYNQHDARVVEVSSTNHRTAIEPDLVAFVGKVPEAKVVVFLAGDARPIAARLAARDKTYKLDTTEPVFVGLVAPSTSSGVFENLAHTKSYKNTDDDSVLDYLAANLYTGHGAHSIFMKTWAAGLAYSNGVHPTISRGTLDYYAERCPLLPQTLRFVIDELGKAKPDANIARYAIAGVFDSRVASSFEGRASAMANDLEDGTTPDVIKTFRARVLAMAKRPDLADELFKRMPGVYAKVLPGMGALDPGATYFVIGPDKQLDAYAQYLAAKVSKATQLHRLYPRDYWVTP